MSSSSSSDTDEEEKKRLQESVMGFQLETSKKTKVEKIVKKKPSMRTSQDDEVRESILNTTPEFRNFVGKKLDSYFDSMLEDTRLNEKKTKIKEKDQYAGIKLLKKSSITLKDSDDKTEVKKKKRKKKYLSSSDDDEEMERIRSAAVSVDFVTKGSAINQDKDGNFNNYCDYSTTEENKKHKKKKKKSKKDIIEAVG